MAVPAIVYWEDPIMSGTVFGSVLVVLLSLASYSLITVASYTCLALLLGFHCFLRPLELESLRASQVIWSYVADGSRSFRMGLLLAPLEVGRPTKTGQWEEAVTAFEMMIGRDVEADIASCNALIGACERGQRWEDPRS